MRALIKEAQESWLVPSITQDHVKGVTYEEQSVSTHRICWILDFRPLQNCDELISAFCA